MLPKSLFRRTLGDVPEQETAAQSTEQRKKPEPITHDRGQRLPFRLRRSAPRGAESVAIILFGLVVGVLGTATIAWLLYRLFDAGELSIWRVLLFLVSAVATPSGYGFAGRGFYQLAASRIPEPLLEIERAELHPGDRLRLLVIQPGPARLDELVVTLMCEKSVREMVTIIEGDHDYATREWHEDDWDEAPQRPVKVPAWTTLPHAIVPILREENVRVPRGGRFERQVVFSVPDDAEPTAAGRSERVEWKFEVEERPRIWPHSLDQYPIVVRR